MPRKTLPPHGTLKGASDRFNEAAARCRGKPAARALRGQPEPEASMRPRPDAAENPPRRFDAGSGSCCFNEAAARCRGKPQYLGWMKRSLGPLLQ